MPEPRILLDGLCFPEAPRWHDGRLYFSDMRKNNRVMAVGLDGNAEIICEVPAAPSGIGWLPDGRMLVVAMTDCRILRLEADGSLVVHADLVAIARGPVNDMVVDRQGRAYVGNFGFDMFAGAPMAPAKLALVHPSGFMRDVASGLEFPNGMVITPDGKTLIVAESAGRRLTGFNIESDGSLSNKRTGRIAAAPARTASASMPMVASGSRRRTAGHSSVSWKGAKRLPVSSSRIRNRRSPACLVAKIAGRSSCARSKAPASRS